MGIFDWLGPTGLGKRRGWDHLPAPAVEQRALTFDRPRSLLVDGVPSFWTPQLATTTTSAADNSAVYACLALIATALTEPPIKVYRVTAGERVELESQSVSALLARPNPYLTLRALLAQVSNCLHVDGNAYWRKDRSGDPLRGNVVQLWPIAPFEIEPYTRSGSDDFITSYRYTPGGRARMLPVENVVHFRHGLNPSDPRLGDAPLRRLLREVASDAQATRYAERLLANLAMPGLALQWDKDAPAMTQQQADEAKAKIMAAYGGDNVGAVAVVGPGGTLTQLGFSPEQMDLRVLHQVPEERIAAVLGVPAAVVGLGAGLEHSIYNNVKQAEEHFTERTLGSLWAGIADTLTLQLLPDFTRDQSIRLDFDTSRVRALSEDADALATRLQGLVASGILTTDEARAQLGYDPLPEPVVPARASERRIVALDTRTSRHDAVRAAPERKAADDLPDRYDEIRADSLPVWERELTAFLTAQLRRVTRRLRAGGDTADDLVVAAEAVLLGETLTPLQRQVLDDVAAAVMGELGIEFGLDDALTRQYLADAGVNIVGITETTRSAVASALVEGQAAGEGIEQLARRLRDLPAFGPARARIVARTELGLSTIQASYQSYVASGVVEAIRILDGDYDAACAARNGRVVSLDQAANEAPLLHPNCTAVWAPIVTGSAAASA